MTWIQIGLTALVLTAALCLYAAHRHMRAAGEYIRKTEELDRAIARTLTPPTPKKRTAK